MSYIFVAMDSIFSRDLTIGHTRSQQVVSSEGVCAVHFADTFTVKNDFNSLNATLVVGTSLGSVIFIAINMPDRGDPRMEEPVVVRSQTARKHFRHPKGLLCLVSWFFVRHQSRKKLEGCEIMDNA